jgi:hypothetical protein
MLAQGRGVSVWNDGAYVGEVQEFCERFAALVAAAEREECALLCEKIEWSAEGQFFAKAIRARESK